MNFFTKAKDSIFLVLKGAAVGIGNAAPFSTRKILSFAFVKKFISNTSPTKIYNCNKKYYCINLSEKQAFLQIVSAL